MSENNLLSIAGDKLGPDVSVLCITYNHVNYICQAIDSFLRQNTRFDYEIIVSDDASTDGTGERVEEKYRHNPRVKIYRHGKNKGPLRNALFALSKCTGRYVMICEGDDYWVDQNKIDIQIDFLENNPDFFGAYCSARVVGSGSNKTIPYAGRTFNSVEEFLSVPYQIPTCSVVFRNKIKGNVFKYRRLLSKTSYICDVLLDTVICEHGKYKFIDRTMGCYRVTTNTSSFSSQSIKKSEFEMLQTRQKIGGYLNGGFKYYLFISTSFVYMSIIVKYSKLSLFSALFRFLKVPLSYKFGVLLASAIIFRNKYFAGRLK